jgi:hypothetical protein
MKLKKIMRSFRNFKKLKLEEGMTLIVSVVLLASVTFISFSISTMLLREITATRLILQSEPAISGANSGGELALFRLLRGAGSVGSSGSLPQSGANYQVEPQLYDNPYIFTVAADHTASAGLYDAENPNNKAADYGSFTITNYGPGVSKPIKIRVVSWGEPDTEICSQNLGIGQSFTCSGLNRPDDRYLITIENTSHSGSASGEIRAFDDAGQAKGVPSDSPGMKVTGQSGTVIRKIQINLQSP